MDADIVGSMAKAALDDSLPFPQIVGELIAQGVEYCHVDYAASSFTFYSAAGATVTAALPFEGLPSISSGWDATALKEAIIDSQRNGQKFLQFCNRAMAAGVQGYFAFLRGQRVTYLGRAGDRHVEWFPGAGPSGAWEFVRARAASRPGPIQASGVLGCNIPNDNWTENAHVSQEDGIRHRGFACRRIIRAPRWHVHRKRRLSIGRCAAASGRRDTCASPGQQ